MRFRTFRISITIMLFAVLIGACSSPIASTSPAETATPPVVAEATSEAATTVPTIAATPSMIPSAAPSTRATPTILAPETATADATTTTEDLTATGSLTDTTAPRVLDDQWYVDSDGNAVPDFIESELGFDPKADDCPYKDCGLGQAGNDLTRPDRNLLVILDSSGSMAAQAGGDRNKLDAAKLALSRYVKVASVIYKIGFMVYGHKGNNEESGKAESCVGIDLLKPIGEVQGDSFDPLLDQFQPTGWTPIAAALEKSKEAFAGKEGALNRIILVSDGLETCNGDPVAVAQQLHEAGLNVQVDVIGFDIQSQEEAAQLRRIAEVGGGSYFDAKTAQELDDFLRQQNEALYQTRSAWTCEIQNMLTVTVCNQQVVNKGRFYISDLRDKASNESIQARRTNPALAEQKAREVQAYRAFIERIGAIDQERQKKGQEAVPRYRELEKQLAELAKQYRAVYDS